MDTISSHQISPGSASPAWLLCQQKQDAAYDCSCYWRRNGVIHLIKIDNETNKAHWFSAEMPIISGFVYPPLPHKPYSDHQITICFGLSPTAPKLLIWDHTQPLLTCQTMREVAPPLPILTRHLCWADRCTKTSAWHWKLLWDREWPNTKT